jgi:hypothetical protein
MHKCESCGNVYELNWIKRGDDYNDFGCRYCPFCGEMFDTIAIDRKP